MYVCVYVCVLVVQFHDITMRQGNDVYVKLLCFSNVIDVCVSLFVCVHGVFASLVLRVGVFCMCERCTCNVIMFLQCYVFAHFMCV